MKEVEGLKRVEGQKKWIHFTVDGLPQLCLYRNRIPRGVRWNVYTPKKGDGIAGDIGDEPTVLKTLTVIPPPGRVMIHSPVLNQPIEWLGCFSRVGAGMVFNAPFDYEALEDTEWLCLTEATRNELDGWNLELVLCEAGEEVTLSDDAVFAVCMKGEKFLSAWVVDDNKKITFEKKTLLGVLERDNV